MLSEPESWQRLREEFLPFRPSQYDLTPAGKRICAEGLRLCADNGLGHPHATGHQRLMRRPGTWTRQRTARVLPNIFSRFGNDALWQHPQYNTQGARFL